MAKTVMGVDYGLRRTGVAFSDPTGTIAGRAFAIEMSDRALLVKKLASLVKEEGVGVIVLGMPLNMNGSAGERAADCSALAAELEAASGVGVVLQDERLTTESAYSYLRAGGTKAKSGKKKVDAVAASIILSQYLDSHR